MNNIAIMKKDELKEIFEVASDQMDLNKINVEKDFWVCWMLDVRCFIS